MVTKQSGGSIQHKILSGAFCNFDHKLKKKFWPDAVSHFVNKFDNKMQDMLSGHNFVYLVLNTIQCIYLKNFIFLYLLIKNLQSIFKLRNKILAISKDMG